MNVPDFFNLHVHTLLFCIDRREKKMDKTWMAKSWDTREYRDKCRSFVDFVVRNSITLNGKNSLSL